MNLFLVPGFSGTRADLDVQDTCRCVLTRAFDGTKNGSITA